MNVLIIEDEKLAEEYLRNLLHKTARDIVVAGSVDSVKNSIQWFLQNPAPDLVFMDIDLGDGLCFEIFDVVDVTCPIIFTTAYDQFAIKAFKVNSIDYLLKPIDRDELQRALEKLARLTAPYAETATQVRAAGRLLMQGYKERFIVKIGEHIKTLPVAETLFFLSRDKSTYVATVDGRNYPIDYALDRLEELLDPADFFRINRKYIVRYGAILDIIAHSNSRLKIRLKSSDDDDIIVARERVSAFKEWLDR